MGDYCFSNAIYMMGETPEEWKTVLPLLYTGCFKTYITNFSWVFPTPK